MIINQKKFLLVCSKAIIRMMDTGSKVLCAKMHYREAWTGTSMPKNNYLLYYFIPICIMKRQVALPNSKWIRCQHWRDNPQQFYRAQSSSRLAFITKQVSLV